MMTYKKKKQIKTQTWQKYLAGQGRCAGLAPGQIFPGVQEPPVPPSGGVAETVPPVQ